MHFPFKFDEKPLFYRLNFSTFICFLPFSHILFSSILIDRAVDIHLPLHSHFSFTLKNLCKCHSEHAVTREQQFKLWAQLSTALFQHLFKSASDVTVDRQTDRQADSVYVLDGCTLHLVWNKSQLSTWCKYLFILGRHVSGLYAHLQEQ